MKNKLIIGLILILVLLIFTGCAFSYFTYSHLIGFKPDKQIKKESKSIRKMDVLLNANYEGTQNEAYLKIRTKNYFDLFWGSAYGWLYFAGRWEKRSESDTIRLIYFKGHRPNGFDTILIFKTPVSRRDSNLCDSKKVVYLVKIDSNKRFNYPFCITENKLFK